MCQKLYRYYITIILYYYIHIYIISYEKQQ